MLKNKKIYKMYYTKISYKKFCFVPFKIKAAIINQTQKI